MSSKDKETQEVRRVIDELIQTATNYNVDALEHIYHEDLKVVMVDTSDNVNTVTKAEFKALFQSKRDAGDPPMNTWSHFHKIEVNENKALVLLSRKNNLSGKDMTLFLSIDLVFESGRWQVLREVIFIRPDDTQ